MTPLASVLIYCAFMGGTLFGIWVARPVSARIEAGTGETPSGSMRSTKAG